MTSRPCALAMLIALAALLAACQQSVAPRTVIDGFIVGERYECFQEGDFQGAECRTYVPVAIVGFDKRDPDHPPIAYVTLHRQIFPDEHGRMPDPNSQILSVCSGGCMSIAVFHLVDGSLRAIAVGTPGISMEAFTIDYGAIPTPLAP